MFITICLYQQIKTTTFKLNNMNTPSQNLETTLSTIARAWVLEHGRDCDGTCTRGKVNACGNLLDAQACQWDQNESSDGNTYHMTEKWSDVVDYCENYFMDYDRFAMVNYIPQY